MRSATEGVPFRFLFCFVSLFFLLVSSVMHVDDIPLPHYVNFVTIFSGRKNVYAWRTNNVYAWRTNNVVNSLYDWSDTIYGHWMKWNKIKLIITGKTETKINLANDNTSYIYQDDLSDLVTDVLVMMHKLHNQEHEQWRADILAHLQFLIYHTVHGNNTQPI